MDGISILREITNERTENERQIVFRHPWVNLVYNWLIALLVVAIAISFVVWAEDIRTRHKAESMYATAIASYEAKQQEEEDAIAAAQEQEEASEERVLEKKAKALAKLYYGADRFREKYGYSNTDFDTLGRCVTNRIENSQYPNDIYEVINQPEQWVGYYETNPVITEYYELAYSFLKAYQSETTKPVSNEYVWAEYTPNGIYLKNDFNADGYARRYHA